MIKQHKTKLLVKQESINQIYCLTNDETLLYYVQEKQLKALDMRSNAIQGELHHEFVFHMIINIVVQVLKPGRVRVFKNYVDLIQRKIYLQITRRIFLLINYKLEHLSFMPQTHIVVSIERDLCIRFFDFNSRETIYYFFYSQERQIITIEFIQNNKWQILIDNQCHVLLMKCQTKRSLSQFKLRKETLYQSKLIADGQIIILSTNGQFIYSFQKGKLIRKIAPNFNLRCLISEMRIYYLKQKAIQVIDLQTGWLREFPIELPSSFCKAFLSKISESLLIASLTEIHIIKNYIIKGVHVD